MKIYPLTLTILAGVLNTVVWASDQPDASTTNNEEFLDLEVSDLLQLRVVEIATGKAQTIDEAPAITNVITAADIEEMGAVDLDEVLESVPGLHVVRNSTGYNPVYTIRGIYSLNNAQVLILINGIQAGTLQTGGRSLTWSGVPLNSISRIEVMRGPGSAIYGADAFSGVINIITKEKKDIHVPEVGMRVGSFDTVSTWMNYAASVTDDVDAALMLEYKKTNGSDAVIQSDLQTVYDRLLGTQASLAPSSINIGRETLDARVALNRGNWKLRASYQGLQDAGNGVGTNQALDPYGRFEAEVMNADLSYNNKEFSKDWELAGQLAFTNNSYGTEENNRVLPAGAILTVAGTPIVYPNGYILNPGVSERHLRFDVSTFYKGLDKHLLRIGIGFHYGEIYDVNHVSNVGIDPATGRLINPLTLVNLSDTSQAFLSTGSRKNSHIFVQDAWSFATNWELTAGLRYDTYSDFGSAWNPRLALVWRTREDLTSKLLYGKAFRAPSFAELYNVNNPIALGNPNLEPETIETLELAFNYHPTERLQLNLSLFNYRWRDAIRYAVEGNGTSYRSQNIGSQDGYGFELESKWQALNNLSLLANFSWQHSEDKDIGENSGYAPSQQLYLRSDWRFMQNWHFNTQLNWVMNRHRAYPDPRQAVDDYYFVDAAFRRRGIQGRWDFAFGVKNVFDQEGYEPSRGPDQNGIIAIPYDLPLAGRRYFAEIRYFF